MIYAMSDVHGQYDLFLKRIEQIRPFLFESDSKLILLGDFCFRNGRQEQWYVKQLKGHKHLILGNHDIKIQANEEAMSYFESVDQITIIKDGEKDIVLCHFPLASWPMENHDSWHIYGHVHGNRESGGRADAINFMRSKERALNAGCMLNDFTPASFEELTINNHNFWKGQLTENGVLNHLHINTMFIETIYEIDEGMSEKDKLQLGALFAVGVHFKKPTDDNNSKALELCKEYVDFRIDDKKCEDSREPFRID